MNHSMEKACEPIDMVLFCPACGLQHIDAPEWQDDPHDIEQGRIQSWKNEPHRSHLCHGCGHIWRPADVPTNGVQSVKTVGKADSPIATKTKAERQAETADALDAERWRMLPAFYEEYQINGMKLMRDVDAALAAAQDTAHARHKEA